MADNASDTPPDRLSLDPRSEHYRRSAAEPRRRHQVQRAGKDQRHRILRSPKAGSASPPGRSRDRFGQPMTIKLKGKVEPYFENPPRARLRTRRSVRRIRRRRRGAGRATCGMPSRRAPAPPAPARCAVRAPLRRSRGLRPSRPVRPATFSPSHAPASLPNIATHSFANGFARSTRRAWRMFPTDAWESPPTLGWENPPLSRANQA